MDKTIKTILKEAEKYFYKAWLEEPQPEEIRYYKDYFSQYPNKGNFTDFYNRALSPRIKVYTTSYNYNRYCDPDIYLIPQDIDRLKADIEETKSYYI